MPSSTGTWEPNTDALKPDPDRVSQWAQRQWDDHSALTKLDDLDKASLQRWISLPLERWEPVLDGRTPDELVHLMRLFTLAEQHLPGCEAGDQSPVITAFRLYRKATGKPDPTLTRWIKANTDNRFLPYGPVL
ncbi:MAG: hypothetical protein WEB07_00910 [Natronospirillum sp.]